MKSKKSTETRDHILLAAANVVLEQGAARMTLDFVAKQAGVSKGGLLYHFPSKDALVEGLINYMIQSLSDRIRAAYDNDSFGTNRGRWLRALTQANFQSKDQKLSSGLSAAVLLNPNLLEALRDAYVSRQALIEQDGVDIVLANIIRLVGDGIWFSELFSFAPPKEPLKQQILEMVLSWTTDNSLMDLPIRSNK